MIRIPNRTKIKGIMYTWKSSRFSKLKIRHNARLITRKYHPYYVLRDRTCGVFLYLSRAVERQTLFTRTHQDFFGFHSVFVTGDNCRLWWSTEKYCVWLSCYWERQQLGRTLQMRVQNWEYLRLSTFQPTAIHSITKWGSKNHVSLMFKAIWIKEANCTEVVTG